MVNSWRKLELFVLNSRLRWPLLIITILLGVFFYIKPNLVIVMLLVFFIGVTGLFEGLHPSGAWKYRPLLLRDIIPKSVLQIILYIKRILLIAVGVYLVILVIMMVLSHLFD